MRRLNRPASRIRWEFSNGSSASLPATARSTIQTMNMSALAGFITPIPSSRSLLCSKRAVYGQFHHVSEAHLHRYLAEADFKYNHRIALGIDDAQRAAALLAGAAGKRLYYRPASQT